MDPTKPQLPGAATPDTEAEAYHLLSSAVTRQSCQRDQGSVRCRKPTELEFLCDPELLLFHYLRNTKPLNIVSGVYSANNWLGTSIYLTNISGIKLVPFAQWSCDCGVDKLDHVSAPSSVTAPTSFCSTIARRPFNDIADMAVTDGKRATSRKHAIRRRRQDKPAISARLILDDHIKNDVGILSEDLFSDLFPYVQGSKLTKKQMRPDY